MLNPHLPQQEVNGECLKINKWGRDKLFRSVKLSSKVVTKNVENNGP